VTRRLAAELGAPPADVRVRMSAAGVTGLLLAIAERAGADPDAADPLADPEQGVAFLHAGLGRA
jgi:hypothetical protein